MRWLVEVTSLGRTEKESLYVEADSWQKALQAARTQRGEADPMSGFSIELLDDGCRAVDPASRLVRGTHAEKPPSGRHTRAARGRPPPVPRPSQPRRAAAWRYSRETAQPTARSPPQPAAATHRQPAAAIAAPQASPGNAA